MAEAPPSPSRVSAKAHTGKAATFLEQDSTTVPNFAKRSVRRVEPENTTKKKTHGDKLKNEQSRAKAMREKLRHGKADTVETKLEIKKTAQIHKQGRKATRKNMAVSGEIRHQLNEANEDNKQVREEHGLKPGTSIRPYLTTKQIEAIDRLQRVDIGLLVSTPDFQERKRYLEWYYMKKLQ